MFRTIHKILRYNMIYMIRTLYRAIYEHLRYCTIRRYDTELFPHDMYRVSYDTDNYGH